VDFEVFEETKRGEVPGRVHYVERNTLGPALCGLSQVDNSVHNRWVSLMLPLNLPDRVGFDSIDGLKCDRCEKLHNHEIET
jgi:hypothetical protein